MEPMNIDSYQELVQRLRDFTDAKNIIFCSRDCELKKKKKHQDIFDFAVDKSIYRAFKNEIPSKRYKEWSWYNKGEELVSKLNNTTSQVVYDELVELLADSLFIEWKDSKHWKNPDAVDKISHMEKGLAYKITNLVLKHFVFSKHITNSELINYLHVPWDKYTLVPLHKICSDPKISPTASQSFVADYKMYKKLHDFISKIAEEAGVPRIYYELMAWDGAH